MIFVQIAQAIIEYGSFNLFIIGTYNQVHRIEWHNLIAHDFKQPLWEELYPINNKGLPTGIDNKCAI